MRNAQTAPQFVREPLVALLAHRFLVVLEEFGLLVELLVADRAREVVHTPCLIEGGENVTGDDLIADEAQVSKQLMIVRLAVGHATLLVVPVTKERLLTLGTHEMLHMPVFAERRYNAFLDRPTASATDRNAHAIVAPQTVQLVHVVGRVPAAVLYLTCRRIQLGSTRRTVEVIPVVNFTPEA